MNSYYNKNAQVFFEGTAYVDMSENYKDFLAGLPQGGKILDAGCGSGRDSRKFLEYGYDVVAMDGSVEMCRLASKFIGQDVLHKQFQEVDFKQMFDGIWAAASLLHVPSCEIEMVLCKLRDSLKEDGILHASFKYGDFEGERNGRYFNDLTQQVAEELFTRVGFNVIKIWITGDVREGRQDEKWVNILVKKLYRYKYEV